MKLSDVKSNRKEFKKIEAGEYIVKVVKSVGSKGTSSGWCKSPKSGNRYLKLIFRVERGEFKNSVIFHNLVLLDSCAWLWKDIIEAMFGSPDGWAIDQKLGIVTYEGEEVDEMKFVGKSAFVKVDIDKDGNADIKAFLDPKDAPETVDDDEEDSEEDEF